MIRSLLEKLRCVLREEFPPAGFEAQPGARQKPPERIRIVALVVSQRDRDLLAGLAAEQDWGLSFASSCGEAWTALNETKAPIVLCDRELPATEWRDVIQMMVSSAHQAYVILLSKVADDYLWDEVIRRGGHDLLATPLREQDVLRAIRLGWSYWSNSSKRTSRFSG